MINKGQASPRSLKNILINPGFQIKLLGYFVVMFFITTISLYSTTFLFFWKLKQKALNVGIPEGHVFFQFLANQKSDLDSLFVGLAIFNLLVLIGVGLFLSHRIAGPIHKLKMHLSKLPNDSEDFKLRENDFFQELGPLVKSVKEKIK